MVFCKNTEIRKKTNDTIEISACQVTPVAIAFLKGHLGLVDYLLGRPGVDINFKDDKGNPV